MKKRIICALIAVSVTGTVSSARAFGGGYPEHPVTNPPVKETENSLMNCWTPSDARYMFTVGGKRFVLLDTDAEGNYFIITEDEYGKYPFTTAYGNTPAVETYVASTGEYGRGPAYDMDDGAWAFDTENRTSIGYWLNHEFLENGNGSSFVLPDEIKSSIIEKDWQVEGFKPITSWTVANYGGDKSHANAFVDTRYRDGYTVKGKVALLSYTEYKRYESVIGWTYCSAGWDGFMLRTPYALITADASVLTYKYGSMQVKNQSASVDTSKKMLIAGNDTPATANFYVRPVMWLDKDFFIKTAVDVSSAGEIVKEEISKNTMASLSEIYSDDELKELGFDVDGAPKAENVSVSGTPAQGAVLYAKYDYASSLGIPEGDSEIEWFISDTADGEYISTGVTDKFIKLDETMIGKYLKCRVMPRDTKNASGKYCQSGPASAVVSADIPVVSDVSVNGTDMSVTVKNNAARSEEIKVIRIGFNSEHQLVSVAGMEPVSVAEGGEITRSIDISRQDNEAAVSVMVWVRGSQPVFRMSFFE